MQLTDIHSVRINWMIGWVNDPDITFVLKRDRKIADRSTFHYRTYGPGHRLFFAQHENEVNFLTHNPSDHNGFGGRHFLLKMADDWDPVAAGWRDCNCHEPQWGSGGGTMHSQCIWDPVTRMVSLKGPWSSGEAYASQVTGMPCVHVATLEGNSRLTIASPTYYHRMKRRYGDKFQNTGTAYATSYRLDFVREAIDRFAPHAELWEGDYGWTVKIRGGEPKNPRRRPKVMGHPECSAEQSAAIYH